MISDAMVATAARAYGRDEDQDDLNAMRTALEAIEGSFEQKIANDTVREGRMMGRCPTCGADFE